MKQSFCLEVERCARDWSQRAGAYACMLSMPSKRMYKSTLLLTASEFHRKTATFCMLMCKVCVCVRVCV